MILKVNFHVLTKNRNCASGLKSGDLKALDTIPLTAMSAFYFSEPCWLQSSFYRPQGNVFTPVCQSFCSQVGGVCPIACWDTHTPLGRYPLTDYPLQADPAQTEPPPGRHPPRQTPPPPGYYGIRRQQMGGTHAYLWVFFAYWAVNIG